MRSLASFAALLVIAAPSAFATDIPLDQRRSDVEFISAGTRAMQSDETQNPGMLTVLDG